MERRPALDHVLRMTGGRVRLGWRLTLFLAMATVITGLLGVLAPGGIVASSFALLLGSVIAGWLLLAMDERGPDALGFYADPASLSEGAKGLGLGVAVALVVVALLFLLGGVRWTTQPGSVTGWMLGGLGALAFLAVPAAAEEALLRGYPLQALTEAWGPAAALGVTSVLFGALHLGNPGVTAMGTLNVIVAGVFLGIVYLRTASLWWATGAHLGWNWAHGYVADVPVSGLELMDAPFYEGVMRGPAWLGGEGFGPEGSLVATAVLAAAAIWCWRTDWLRPGAAALAARPLAVMGGRDA